MSDLADFILARIAEEERACQSRLYGRVAAAAEELVSPGRLMLHCAARRKVVKLHEIHIVDDGLNAMIDGESGSGRAGPNERDYLCPTLRLLALPYFDHPDFQPQWQVATDFLHADASGMKRAI